MASLNTSIARKSASGRPTAGPTPVPLPFRDDPLLWAGWLYARDGMTQNEIAKAMGVSRATVNGYLAEARTRGIVTLSMETSRLSELMIAQAMKDRFNLSDCIVIPSAETDQGLDERLGETGARVLQRLIRPGDTLGIAWGRTMIALARRTAQARVFRACTTGYMPEALLPRFGGFALAQQDR